MGQDEKHAIKQQVSELIAVEKSKNETDHLKDSSTPIAKGTREAKLINKERVLAAVYKP